VCWTLREARGSFPGTTLPKELVFPRAETVAATEDILNDNDVRAQGSPDMLKVWQAKGSH
jgi:hypothetical protein